MKKIVVASLAAFLLAGCSYSESDLQKALSVCKDSGSEMEYMTRFIDRIDVKCKSDISVGSMLIDKVKLLKEYSAFKSEYGKPYEPTEFDKRCAELAEKFTEEELRGAAVIRATYNRAQRQKKT